MPEFKKTSRADLYASESDGDESGNEQFLGYGNIDLEFVEVNDSPDGEDEENIKEDEVEEKEDKQSDEEEYEFPLFGGASKAKAAPSTENPTSHMEIDPKDNDEVEFPLFGSSTRGRTATRTMKISLREASEERIVNERPADFYFASYTSIQKSQFEISSISYEQIITHSKIIEQDPSPWRVLDVNEYNSKVEKRKQEEKDRKLKIRKRPGKKKRAMKIICKERNEERAKAKKAIEKQELAKLKKKMFHKRGGKKNKKKDTGKAEGKPKYRTE